MGIRGSTKAKKICLPRTSKAKNKLVFHLSCERNNFNPLVIPVSLISYAKGGNPFRQSHLGHNPRTKIHLLTLSELKNAYQPMSLKHSNGLYCWA